MTGFSTFDIYALFCIEGIGTRKINRILNSDEINFECVERLVAGLNDEKFESLSFLNTDDIESLKSVDIQAILDEFNSLSNYNIGSVDIRSMSYPPLLRERLGPDAPPILFSIGNPDIISMDSISIVGSRDVSAQGLEFTRRLVEGLKNLNISVVSGGARGIDSAAHQAAIENGLKTVIIVAHGIKHVIKRGIINDLGNSVLYLSHFYPNAGWSPLFAMVRNKTVCAKSKAVFVVEAGECSGTINTGEAALRLGVPLYVVSPSEFDEPPNGNRYLISKGGQEIFLDSVPGVIEKA